MTRPRIHVSGATYLVERRTALGALFLVPFDPSVHEGIRYTFAVCARKFGVEVHAVAVLPDRIRYVVSSGEKLLPEFTHQLHLELSKFVRRTFRKFRLDVPSSVWSAERPEMTQLVTVQSQLDAIAAVCASPVVEGLSKRARSYPGWVSAPGDMIRAPRRKGRVETRSLRRARVVRPDVYFGRRRSDRPRITSLRMTLPATVRAAFRRPFRLVRELARVVRFAERTGDGAAVVDVRLLDPWLVPRPSEHRRVIRPYAVLASYALHNFCDRIWRLFQRDHAAARHSQRQGRGARFPQGTFLAVRAGAVLDPSELPPDPLRMPRAFREEGSEDELLERARRLRVEVPRLGDTLAARLVRGRRARPRFVHELGDAGW